jgi:hypothetical protein
VKLTSGDVNWRDLHALRFHFLTQPLPTPLAWYAHQLPGKFLDVMTALTLVIETLVPFGIFGPRRVRQIAASILMLLQFAIIITGNYGFFNLLTLALCLWLFDDRTFAPVSRYLRVRSSDAPALQVAGNLSVALLMFFATAQIFRMNSTVTRPSVLRAIERTLSPFEIVNTYGLFAVMTTTRSEIVLQGSNDAEHWIDFEMPYKPGDPHRSLPLVAPYMPRLDWQMWFAALSSFNENRWVGGVMYRLMVGDVNVANLFQTRPLSRPRYMRAVLYDYSFTSPKERQQTGAIWKREPRGNWFGPVSLTGR